MLHSQLPWWIGGPLLGLCVVAMRWLMNLRLGVMGGWSDVVTTIGARRLSFGPFGWMLLGLIAGATAFALIAGGPDFHGYGWLTDTFSGTSGTIAHRRDPVRLRGAHRPRHEDRRRLHVRQRAERQRDAVAREPCRHDDVLRDRHRRHRHHGGPDLMSTRIAAALIGVVFGAVLSWSGMTSPEIIREGLLFQRPLPVPLLRDRDVHGRRGAGDPAQAARRRRCSPASASSGRPSSPSDATSSGSVLFGIGWGVSGACPGPIATQLGQGIVWGVPTTIGLVLGIVLFGRLQKRAARDGARGGAPAATVIPSPVAADATA